MVQYRKDKICRAIAKPLRQIRNIHEPESEYLFGEDINAKLTAAAKNHRILASSGPRGRGRGRGKNWNTNNRDYHYDSDSRYPSKNGKNWPTKGTNASGNRRGKRGGRKGGFPPRSQSQSQYQYGGEEWEYW